MNEQHTSSESVMPIENMTQPMGPLEEGDQALVDVVNRIPEGEQDITDADGTRTYLRKEQGLRPDGEGVFRHSDVEYRVTALARNASGYFEDRVMIDKEKPGAEGIRTHTTEPPGLVRPAIRYSTMGNVEEHKFAQYRDRSKVQATKLEVARRINEAHERLGEVAVEAADK